MRTIRIEVRGIVQGVGFRPFVDRLAAEHGVLGSVANRGSYVEVFVQAAPETVEAFARDIRDKAPERSLVMRVAMHEVDQPPYTAFDIVESEREQGDIFVSPDIATCPKCQRELFAPSDRRYLHPFINCTACGPRLTILDSMPYDRERTSMGEFPMCDECAFEYTHAETRRYDAQPVCCPDCGPHLFILGTDLKDGEAISHARRIVMEGGIVAVKGIGGFHLCCNARNASAVARLRDLKHRPSKPFAVMLRDLKVAQRTCDFTPEQQEILEGWQKPILILPWKKDSGLAEEVAPGGLSVGVMLPYTPLHMLLFSQPDGLEMTDALVMTSGNASGAPICRTTEDASTEIACFCDAILSHDRKIRLRCDDTVLDFRDGEPSMVRRSRGYAPLPAILSGDWKGQVLGIGGELKNAFTLSSNELFYLSPYVGDLGDLRTVRALSESVARMAELLEIKPRVVACDMHPLYNSVHVAEGMGLPVLHLQHHYAHILSCMAENDIEGPVIGVSFDGTGYGTDATVWGGEILACDYAGFRRLASIAPFWQAGGDVSAREGWRIATAMLGESDLERNAAQRLDLCTDKEQAFLSTMVARKINTVLSTSAGRLFDAASALLGVRRASTFEGEASMALQAHAERWLEGRTAAEMAGKIAMPWDSLRDAEDLSDGRFLLQSDRLAFHLAEERLAGKDSGELAFRFHALLARMTSDACARAADETGIGTCALSGGVLQNRLFASLCISMLGERGLKVIVHRLVPPNDGGISLGQAVCASWRLARGLV